MRRKKSLLIPAVLAFSLCTGAVFVVSSRMSRNLL